MCVFASALPGRPASEQPSGAGLQSSSDTENDCIGAIRGCRRCCSGRRRGRSVRWQLRSDWQLWRLLLRLNVSGSDEREREKREGGEKGCVCMCVSISAQVAIVALQHTDAFSFYYFLSQLHCVPRLLFRLFLRLRIRPRGKN